MDCLIEARPWPEMTRPMIHELQSGTCSPLYTSPSQEDLGTAGSWMWKLVPDNGNFSDGGIYRLGSVRLFVGCHLDRVLAVVGG